MRVKIKIFGTILLTLFFIMSYGFGQMQMANAAEKMVKVGALLFTTGPAGECGLPMGQGMWDYTRWINERGGLDGVKVVLKWEDTKFDPGLVMPAYKRLVETEKVLGLCSLGTLPNTIITKTVMEDKIPVVCAGSAYRLMWPVKRYWFSAAPPFTDQMRGLTKWLMERHWKKERPARFGYISWDNDYGHEGLIGLKAYGKEVGFEIVSIQLVPMGIINLLPKLLP